MQTLKQRSKSILGYFGLFNAAQALYQICTPQGRHWKKKIGDSEKLMTDFYSQFVKPGDLCFDVGANFGYRTAAFLKLGASVVAVEPQDIAMENLRLRFGRNKLVTLVQAGAADKVGEREFFMGDKHVASSMSSEWIASLKNRPEYADHQWNKKIIVPVTTLDEIIEQNGIPAFIKIDVEGFEDEVVKGLGRAVPALSLEYNREFPRPALDAIERITTLGAYEFNYSVGESMRLALPEWTSKEDLLGKLDALTEEDPSGDVYARLRVKNL